MSITEREKVCMTMMMTKRTIFMKSIYVNFVFIQLCFCLVPYVIIFMFCYSNILIYLLFVTLHENSPLVHITFFVPIFFRIFCYQGIETIFFGTNGQAYEKSVFCWFKCFSVIDEMKKSEMIYNQNKTNDKKR